MDEHDNQPDAEEQESKQKDAPVNTGNARVPPKIVIVGGENAHKIKPGSWADKELQARKEELDKEGGIPSLF